MKIIMFGPPGVGKGTIAARLKEDLDVPHISTGSMIRDAIQSSSELGKEAGQYVQRGDLVPDNLMIEIVKSRLEDDDCKKGYILDGFPRTIKQAEALQAQGIVIEKVVNLTADDDTLITRISSRRECSSCSANYNLLFVKPHTQDICDRCGASLIQREDDKPGSVKNRLEIYRQKTSPLIGFYKEKGLLIDVDASVNDPSEVYDKVVSALDIS